MDRILEVLARPEYPDLLWRHVSLSAAALAIGTVVALVVAMLVSRSPLGAFIAINVGNVGRAVPSLAILALVFPLPGFGFGFNTALVALTALAIPPILINASTALRQVSPQVIDAARGMGFSNSQILGRIKLPIAAPVIFAGIRTSAVQVVASATLATFVGGGGLGDLIVEGYSRGDNYIMLAGAFSVAVLAIITELGFGGLEWALTPKGLRVGQKRRGK